MTTVEQIAFRRCRVLLQTAESEQQPSPELGAATLLELRNGGLVLTNPDALTTGSAQRAGQWIAWSREERGQLGTYTPLFKGFPERLPDFDLAELRFGIALVRMVPRMLQSPEPLTDTEIRAAMDFSGIGWWPASSVPQDVESARKDREFQLALPADQLKQLTPVTLVNEAQFRDVLRQFALDCLATPTSLREDVRADLDGVLDLVLDGEELPEPGEVPFLETRILLLRRRFQRDPSVLAELGVTPDDILRLLADLAGGDVSLSEKVRYPKLTRAQRRGIISALEATPRLSDVFRRRSLWLAIARGLHLAEFDAPRVQDVFGRLRAGRRDATSLPSRTEALLSEGEIAKAADLLAAEAPGLLMRKLRRIVHLAVAVDQVDAVLDTLQQTAEQVPPRLLWAAYAQFRDNGTTYPRLAITKKGVGLAVAGPAGHLAVPESVLNRVLNVLDTALTRQASEREADSELKLAGVKVWIDPALETVLLPDQPRSTAPGLVQLERGSRVKLGTAPVLRLFLHWKEPKGKTSDLDLSLLALNETFELVSQVSWTGLANGAMTHSGDLTSAPDGAEEFVDVRLDDARAQAGWRYLVPSVYRYSGPSFAGLPEAVLGWMLRSQPSADHATFDASTVVNAFALTGNGPQALPILVDLATDEVTAIDLYTGSGYHNRVENTASSTADLVAGAIARAATRMSVAEVARHATRARRGVLVDDRAGAEVTFGLDENCTFDVRSPESVLNLLLGKSPT